MNRLRSATARVALSLALSLFARVASAQDAPDDGDRDALGNHQRHLRLDVGLRTQLVPSAGLDPFSTDDLVPQLTLGASYYFWSRDRWSLGAAAAFDYGRSSAPARSAHAELDTRRFWLAPEVRYHVLRVLALTAKVGPTLTREEATYSGGLAADLRKTAWKAGVDATAGVAFELFGYASGHSNKPRLWLTAEGGYGYTAANRLRLAAPEESGAPQRLTPLDLGELSLSGPLCRVTAALSFW